MVLRGAALQGQAVASAAQGFSVEGRDHLHPRIYRRLRQHLGQAGGPARRSPVQSELRLRLYGFKTALFGDVPAFDEEAAKLDRMLTHLEEDYKSITIVTHSKGGLLAMRTLLNRAKDFPSKQPYKIHRIVMFTPLTENVSLAGQPKLVKLLGEESADIAQMQASTYSELGRVKEDLKALLDAQDPLTA